MTTRQRDLFAADDVPVINVSSAPCGTVDNPHTVTSPTCPMRCTSCGEVVPARAARPDQLRSAEVPF